MSVRACKVLALLATSVVATAAFAGMHTAFAYRLSDPGGELELRWASLSWDPAAGELYVVDSSNGMVSVFNDAGMQIYSFGDDAALGNVLGVVALPNGELVVLSRGDKSWSLLRCNFRGEPQSKIAIADLPFAGFSPSALKLANGSLYLIDKGAMQVVAVGIDGAVRSSWNLPSLLKLDTRRSKGNDIRGFNVDAHGNIVGTVPTLFFAFAIAPDGTVKTFGERGGAPGKFNVAAGIATDDAGRFYVTDTLKCAVLIFGPDGKFIDQFGYRGDDDGEGLLAPQDIAVIDGKIFVSQSRGGVKAFDILLD
jgi:DNA-binding beta-propeller fold protein YncE